MSKLSVITGLRYVHSSFIYEFYILLCINQPKMKSPNDTLVGKKRLTYFDRHTLKVNAFVILFHLILQKLCFQKKKKSDN